MRIHRLLILLLSFKTPIIASAQLVERQPQGVWPDWNPGQAFWNSLTVLGGIGTGIGNFFLNPQDSDSSKTTPSPGTDTKSDRQASPDFPKVAPASPPSSATSSSAEPAYKIGINNDLSPLPGLGSDLPAVLPSANEECDLNLINVSLQVCSFFKLPYQRMTLALTPTDMSTRR